MKKRTGIKVGLSMVPNGAHACAVVHLGIAIFGREFASIGWTGLAIWWVAVLIGVLGLWADQPTDASGNE